MHLNKNENFGNLLYRILMTGYNGIIDILTYEIVTNLKPQKTVIEKIFMRKIINFCYTIHM